MTESMLLFQRIFLEMADSKRGLLVADHHRIAVVEISAIYSQITDCLKMLQQVSRNQPNYLLL